MPTSATRLREPIAGSATGPALPAPFWRHVGVLLCELMPVNAVGLHGVARRRPLGVLQGVHPRRDRPKVGGVHTLPVATHDVIEHGPFRNRTDKLLPDESGRLLRLQLGVPVLVAPRSADPAPRWIHLDPVLPPVREHRKATGDTSLTVQMVRAQTAVERGGHTPIDGTDGLLDSHVTPVVPAPTILSRRPIAAIDSTVHGLNGISIRKDVGSLADPQ